MCGPFSKRMPYFIRLIRLGYWVGYLVVSCICVLTVVIKRYKQKHIFIQLLQNDNAFRYWIRTNNWIAFGRSIGLVVEEFGTSFAANSGRSWTVQDELPVWQTIKENPLFKNIFFNVQVDFVRTQIPRIFYRDGFSSGVRPLPRVSYRSW